jgi:hypothetical protein
LGGDASESNEIGADITIEVGVSPKWLMLSTDSAVQPMPASNKKCRPAQH